MNKANHEYYMNQIRKNANAGALPPLVAGQSVSGHPGPGGNYNIKNYHPGGNLSSYQQNAYRPSKLRSL